MSRRSLRRVFLLGVGLFYLLHNDLWLWNEPRLVLGLPAGLVYHVAYCLGAAALMGLLLMLDPPAAPSHGPPPEPPA
jgi:hypothetical protein